MPFPNLFDCPSIKQWKCMCSSWHSISKISTNIAVGHETHFGLFKYLQASHHLQEQGLSHCLVSLLSCVYLHWPIDCKLGNFNLIPRYEWGGSGKNSLPLLFQPWAVVVDRGIWKRIKSGSLLTCTQDH